jgi:hypothetical protein
VLKNTNLYLQDEGTRGRRIGNLIEDVRFWSQYAFCFVETAIQPSDTPTMSIQHSMVRSWRPHRSLLRSAVFAGLFFWLFQVPTAAQPLARYELTTGWATFGLALPQGVAREAVQVGSLRTQTDVKTKWPDGSIRFAVVTAQVPARGTYPITGSAPPGGTPFRPSWPSASVEFVVAGQKYVADLPRFAADDPWLTGALVSEARTIVSPRAGSGAHPLLQVIFDVRSYSDASHRVDVTVQNVQDAVAADAVAYDVTVRLNGSAVYEKRAVKHAYLTRWRKTFATPNLAESFVTPDFAPFVSAGLIPRFASTVANSSPGSVEGPRYDILTWGDMNPNMPAPGGRSEIGFYPYWTVQYLVHRTPALRAYVLKHGDLSASWSGHITEADGRTLISLDRYPIYWLDRRSVGRPNGPATLTGVTNPIENAHMPTLTYVPYLATGDRYYLDQTKLWGNFAMLSTWPIDRLMPRGGEGILMQNQIRGIAWGLRALGEATVATPDNDPDKAYFTARVRANLEALDRYSREEFASFGPLEMVFPGKWGTSTGSFTNGALVQFSPWMNQYVAWVLDYLGGMGFEPVAHLRDRVARFWVRLFTSDPEYPRKFGAPYMLRAARVKVVDGRVTYEPATTMKQVFCDTFTCPTPDPTPGYNPFPGYYGPEARAGLLLAERLKIPGAADARAWLEAQPGVMEDVNKRSGFALASPTDRGASAPSGPAPPLNVRIVR